jgi:hypothetical protein
MILDPSRVPQTVQQLIPIAERWGIADDGFREDALSNASARELNDIVHAVESCDSELNSWLCGDESFWKRPTPEYVAFSALMMAADWAKVELRRQAWIPDRKDTR